MFDFFRNILRAFGTSLRLIASPKVTLDYPNEQEKRSDKARQSHAVDLKKCVACGTCAKACPAKAISIKNHCAGDKKVLDAFSIDYGKCCFCGICEAACHKKAITMTEKNKQSYRKNTIIKHVKKEQIKT